MKGGGCRFEDAQLEMSMEAEYERTRDRARAFLAVIDELSTFRDQVSRSDEEGKEGLESALEVSVLWQRQREGQRWKGREARSLPADTN